ncbi:MAG: hypothetical protein PHT84_00985 [Candidatus Pacebacteria bacterium]|nr:hypothetical protein [Candidatus Paceibacterota bacterium]
MKTIIVEAAEGQAIVDVCRDVEFTSIGNIFNWASCTLVKSVIPFLFSLATVAFIWGIIQYFMNPDNEEKRKKGKSFLLWGLIGLFVMISVWGLVAVFSNTFGIRTLIPQLSQ